MFGNNVVGNIVTVKVNKKIKESINVTFPLYRKHDLSLDCDDVSTVIYEKIIVGDKNRLICYSVSVTDDFQVELEIDSNHHIHEDSDPDYVLGKEEYESSKEEFDEAVNLSFQLLGKFKS